MSGAPIWRVLAIAPTSDEKLIRKAYAERLKVTNPEDDPAGFKTLRAAYEAAMREARWRQQYREDVEDEDELDEFDEDEAESEAAYLTDSEEPLLVTRSSVPNFTVRDVPDETPPRVSEAAPEISVRDAREDAEPPRARDEPEISVRDAPEAEPPRPPSAPDIAVRDAPDPEIHRPRRDETLEAHRNLCIHLERVLMQDDTRAAIAMAFAGVLQSPAMDRLDVHAQTEDWLIYLIHRTQPASYAIVPRAIEYFGWEKAAKRVHDGRGPASIIALLGKAAELRQSEEFLVRVRDRRHEFHRAYLETTKTPSEQSWSTRLFSLWRIGLVQRFIEFVDSRVPNTLQALNAEAVDWWRERIARWSPTLHTLNIIARVGMVVGILALAVVFYKPELAPQPGQTRDASTSNYINVSARDACREAARNPAADVPVWKPTPTSNSCDTFLIIAPETLMGRQYAGIIALKKGDGERAERLFQQILDVSPLDPYALYGKGIAKTLVGDEASALAGRGMMRAALTQEPAVETYFLDFGIGAARDSDEPIKKGLAPAYERRSTPDVDVMPVKGEPIAQDTFDRAYQRFGIQEPFADGDVMLECLVTNTGVMNACRVVSEEPRNKGLAEVAIWVVEQMDMKPATKGGEPVDNVPIRVPVTFKLMNEKPKP